MSNETSDSKSSPVKNSASDVRNRRSCLARANDNNYSGNNVMTVPETKWVHIYINGDEHFSGCRCVVNSRYYRNLDMFLSYLTERLQPSFGAIRQLYTPINGHPKLDLGYSDFGGKRNKRSRFKPKSKFKVSKAKSQCHSTLVIYLYQNGNYKMKPQKMNFQTQDLENLETVYKNICLLNGKPVRSVEELISNQSYVAVGKHELFKVGYYGYNTQKINSARTLYHHPSQKSSVLTTRSGIHSRSSAQSLKLNHSLSSCKSNRATPVSKSMIIKNFDKNISNAFNNMEEYQCLSAYEDFMLKTSSAKSSLVTKST
ncbi:doublecortin domain-containing protein 2 [Caerostris extrusa]|uniref:Doublecortin domain-containing protein 2 n=1 Tax=Caerostris extrusa TaxID=172846 RepID=A0AAV4WB16_CAEEX|nr:doublecortin domain-containing protein 2 [Caerostris extrusa]